MKYFLGVKVSLLVFVSLLLSLSVWGSEYSVLKPYAEYEDVGYVLFHSSDRFDQETNLKREVLRSLPSDVSAVFVVNDTSQKTKNEILEKYSAFVKSPDQIQFLETPRSGRGMRWNRDHAPIPVHVLNKTTGQEEIGLVDHKYFHRTELDTYIANFFELPIVNIHDFSFEGGNFLADRMGRCYIMDNGRVLLTDAQFEAFYGCKKVVHFPNRGFVGHIDERMKIIDDFKAVTDDLEYAQILRAEGFVVKVLPKATGYRTYANSLLINDTVILPIFGEANDDEAIKVYEDLGLIVNPVRGEKMSDFLKGNIHCISMLYPYLD